MSMVLMAGGTILFLWAVFRFFWRGKEWVYAPTGSVAKEGPASLMYAIYRL